MRNRVFPGAVAVVGKDDAVVHTHACGRLTYDTDAGPVVPDTIYDLASLTKVLVTTVAAMMLVDEGRLDVEAPVASHVPEFGGGSKDHVTLAHLLCHASGLPAWAPLYRDTAGRDAFVHRVAAFDLEREPGEASVYSDLGFILLGVALERILGEGLDAFAARRIFGPLGMSDTSYRPALALRPRIAPTEDDPWRGRLVHGEVQDENAYAMGGVAAHAGVFGTAADLSRFVLMVQGGGRWQGRSLIAAETLERFARPCGVPGSSYGLGWDHPGGKTSSAGTLFARSSIGHLGFTGTSLWIDREHRWFVILLSNSVHPVRGNQGLREVRAALADSAAEALRG